MADRVIHVRNGSGSEYVPLLLHDNGDGTYSLGVSGGAGGGGDASAANQTTLNNLVTALSKSEDAIHASGDQGLMTLVVRKDTAAALAGADGDYIPLIVDASGRLHIAPLAAGENHLGETGGKIVRVTGTFTRPADTTAYAANDVVSNSTSSTTLVTLSSAARVNAGTGYIVGCRVATNKKSITPRIRVHVNNASNPTVAADNVQAKTVYADISKRIGSFDLSAMATSADTTNSDMSAATDWTLRIPFKAAADTALYVWLETLDAFTPASGDSWTVELLVDQN